MQKKTPNFETFAKKIGVVFNDINILKTAFTHRSYLNENRGLKLEHNERLEFLGDAVLELVVTFFLFKKYPTKNEGDMTSYRAAIVNTHSLARVGEQMKINDYLLLSRGEEKDTGRARAVITADTMEAVIGAIYIDQGDTPVPPILFPKTFSKSSTSRRSSARSSGSTPKAVSRKRPRSLPARRRSTRRSRRPAPTTTRSSPSAYFSATCR